MFKNNVSLSISYLFDNLDKYLRAYRYIIAIYINFWKNPASKPIIISRITANKRTNKQIQ